MPIQEYRKIKTISNFKFNSSYFGTDIFDNIVAEIWDLFNVGETPADMPCIRDNCWVKLIFNKTQIGSMIEVPLPDKEKVTVFSGEMPLEFEYNYDEALVIDFLTKIVNK